MIADIDTTCNGTIWQSIVRQRPCIDTLVASISKHAVRVTPRIRRQRVSFRKIRPYGIIRRGLASRIVNAQLISPDSRLIIRS